MATRVNEPENEMNWVKSIKEKLQELSVMHPSKSVQEKFRIFRVQKSVKNVKRMHFQPELIFLGLFNKRFDPEIINLKGEKFKLGMVSAFLKIHQELEDGLEWDQICDLVVDDPEGLQRSYFDREEPRHRRKETVRCELTLDAIFLASLLSGSLFEANEVVQAAEVYREHMNPVDQDKARYLKLGNIVENKGLSNLDVVSNDIMKLENQIPLPLIRNVLGILYRDNTAEANLMLNELCRRWIQTISITLPGFSEKHFQRHFVSPEFDFGNECGHFLDCVCRVMRGDCSDGMLEPSSKIPLVDRNDFWGSVKKCLVWLVQLPGLINTAFGLWHLNKSLRKNYHKIEKISIPSMTRLREAGIHVRGDARGTFDLVPIFKPGILKATLLIPTFSIIHRTEILWKNMVAYQSETVRPDERGSVDQFIYFLKFMDELINTHHDVFLLRKGRHPVIPKNLLGTEKDVADLFNSITQQYTVQDPHAGKWVELRSQIDGFVNQRSRLMVLEFLSFLKLIVAKQAESRQVSCKDALE
ncbi:unnamed protein product [Calypogeia fissa]